jgi:hypothetical protein
VVVHDEGKNHGAMGDDSDFSDAKSVWCPGTMEPFIQILLKWGF